MYLFRTWNTTQANAGNAGNVYVSTAPGSSSGSPSTTYGVGGQGSSTSTILHVIKAPFEIHINGTFTNAAKVFIWRSYAANGSFFNDTSLQTTAAAVITINVPCYIYAVITGGDTSSKIDVAVMETDN